MEFENKIIDYLNGNDLQLLLVTKHQRNKMQALDLNRKVLKAKERQVLNEHGTANEESFITKSQGLLVKFAEIAEDFDIELLWETVWENGGELTIPTLEDAYFGEGDALHQSALARQLLLDKVYFKRKGLLFVARTNEEVEQFKLKEAKIARAKEEQEKAVGWLEKVLHDKISVEVPAEQEPLLQQIHAYIFMNQKNVAEKYLQLSWKKRNPKELGIELLKHCDRWQEDADETLLLNGIVAAFSDAAETHANTLLPYRAGTFKQDSHFTNSVSIDAAETREIDDAISFSQDGDFTIIGVHIAAPTEFVQKGDVLDRIAMNRALTLYLPTTVVTMLPHNISCDLASLQMGEARPALSFKIKFDKQAEMVDFDIMRAEIAVDQRLTYDQAEIMMEEGDHTGVWLNKLKIITDKLAKKRQDAGALQLIKPELKVKVKDDNIKIECLDNDSPSRCIVSELMILANRLAAEFALSHDIPIIYRMQDAPSNKITPMTKYDPITFVNSVRQLKKTRLTTHPQPHAGLGLELYTQISSPLRRYADLVMQRQLCAYFANEEFPYKTEKLIEVLGVSGATESENRTLERETVKYWLLEYLQRYRLDDIFEATVVKGFKGRMMAELDEVYVQGVLNISRFVEPGERITITISEIKPKKGILVLKAVE